LDENRLRVFENRVLRRIFVLEGDEVIEVGENCIMRSVINLCSSPSIIRMINSRKMR
jgi:hypothetical protein